MSFSFIRCLSKTIDHFHDSPGINQIIDFSTFQIINPIRESGHKIYVRDRIGEWEKAHQRETHPLERETRRVTSLEGGASLEGQSTPPPLPSNRLDKDPTISPNPCLFLFVL